MRGANPLLDPAHVALRAQHLGITTTEPRIYEKRAELRLAPDLETDVDHPFSALQLSGPICALLPDYGGVIARVFEPFVAWRGIKVALQLLWLRPLPSPNST